MSWRPKRWRGVSRNAPGQQRVAAGMTDTPEPTADDAFELLDGPAVEGQPVLVHALSGFLDAGNARKLAVDHLLATLSHRTVASYDLDDSFDYRARRPRMVFDSDKFTSVDLPEMLLSEVTDAAGTKFLLLHGPEPDVGWQRFIRGVLALVERFDVRLTVGVNAIPWATPHTRPVGVTAHATSSDLIAGQESLGGVIEVPGHLGGMLEFELGKKGKPAIGFAVHVPHYLVGAEYPRAALTMLREVANSTGLVIPADELVTAADTADREIDTQVAENPENVEAIKMLEAQYDAVAASRTGGTPGASLPSGDEIAAQLEDFLRDLGDDKP